jgi:inosose dehydratase
MSKSRREFLIRMAATGAVAGTSFVRNVLAAIPEHSLNSDNSGGPSSKGSIDIRIGYSAIAWRDQDVRAIHDLSILGFPGIQLRANVVRDFPDPLALRDLLAQSHLTFVALSSGNVPLDRALRQSTIDQHVSHAEYLKKAGGRYLQVVPGQPAGEPISPEDFKYEGNLLTEIGKRVADLQLELSLHNHMGTMGQTPDALDAILDNADPRYLKLELDTAHYLQGGGNPTAAVQKYANRILFLHLKDVKSATTKNGYEFTELGQGRVDFPSIFNALKLIHFQGWGIIELDGERSGVTRTPIESAEISKRYLEQTLGVHI